jgi:signal transduction histidine kinase
LKVLDLQFAAYLGMVVQNSDIGVTGAVPPGITGPIIIAGLIVLLALQVFLIGTLLAERQRSRRNAAALAAAQRALRESEERFHSQEKSLVGQKLESMGLLASGIAHDFSNIMGGILASSELALIQHTDGTPHQEELLRIKAAATAGAEIVRQLMGDRETTDPASEPVDCSLLVRETLQILEVSIAKHISLKTELSDNLSMLEGNAAQIRQVIMNLVINATDAIGEQQGEVRVTTRMVRTPIAGAVTLRDGAYVQLEVADTGRGISDEAKGKIFDPFFTTKSAFRGLGLTLVQRVVSSHGGIVTVNSTPGLGSTFQVLLPSVLSAEKQPHRADASGSVNESVSGAARILTIEGEQKLRPGGGAGSHSSDVIPYSWVSSAASAVPFTSASVLHGNSTSKVEPLPGEL